MECNFITYLVSRNRHFSRHFTLKTINNLKYDIMWVVLAAWHGGFLGALQVS